MRVNIVPIADSEYNGVEIDAVDSVSFVNSESYGQGKTFGITENFDGKAVIINVNGITCVEIDGSQA